jgi:Ca2+-binding EF-hand superfamily protein
VTEEDVENTFNAIDVDQDGKISISENVQAYLIENSFIKIDTDKDGYVSATELNAYSVPWPEVLRVFQDHITESSDNALKFYEFKKYFHEKSK